ncbi:MAG: hypothetical protein HY077_00875 [Elusimicrobia bacterium]|nr:hypothetical protein [Elusimicrobiota bacterium]
MSRLALVRLLEHKKAFDEARKVLAEVPDSGPAAAEAAALRRELDRY